MKVINVPAVFTVDSTRFMIASTMAFIPPSGFLFSPTGIENVPVGMVSLAASENIYLEAIDQPSAGTLATLTELAVTVNAGRYEIAGLTTVGLPNNRRYWADFGQLCEDVLFGRIPELLSARFLFLSQNTNKLYWANGAQSVAFAAAALGQVPALGVSTVFSGEENKTAVHFME